MIACATSGWNHRISERSTSAKAVRRSRTEALLPLPRSSSRPEEAPVVVRLEEVDALSRHF